MLLVSDPLYNVSEGEVPASGNCHISLVASCMNHIWCILGEFRMKRRIMEN